MGERGRILRYVEVGCGRCPLDIRMEIRGTHSLDMVRGLGWTISKPYGWICPSCTEDGDRPASGTGEGA